MFLLSAFFYQLQLCMRRTPSIFGCAKSSDVTTNFIYINTMSNVMVKAKKIFLSAKLVLGGKMFGKGDNVKTDLVSVHTRTEEFSSFARWLSSRALGARFFGLRL